MKQITLAASLIISLAACNTGLNKANMEISALHKENDSLRFFLKMQTSLLEYLSIYEAEDTAIIWQRIIVGRHGANLKDAYKSPMIIDFDDSVYRDVSVIMMMGNSGHPGDAYYFTKSNQ